MNDELMRKLGYQFANEKWLVLALTHRSSHHENNERLEFLGDSIVNFVIAEILYQHYPRAQEGDLTRWRATLINRDTLGELGRQFELGRYLHLGIGELKSGGTERLSILSCAMEAIIGAVYLDAGFQVVQECILRWYQPLLDSLTSAASHKDPKTKLQEYLQRKKMALPVYTVQSITGEAHQQMFVVQCSVLGISKTAEGQGSGRRRAEQDAAEKMLDIIKNYEDLT